MSVPAPPARRRPSTPRVTLAAVARLLNAATAEPNAPDPLVLLWREWRRAAAALDRSCRAAQTLERDLLNRLGPLRVEVPLDPPAPRPAYASDAHSIDQLLGTHHSTYSLREHLKAELVQIQAGWDREAEACGLRAAEAAEVGAARRVEETLATAAATPARSLIGTIAKLTIVAEWGRRNPDRDAQPWPFLHSTLADLVDLAAAGDFPVQQP